MVRCFGAVGAVVLRATVAVVDIRVMQGCLAAMVAGLWGVAARALQINSAAASAFGLPC